MAACNCNTDTHKHPVREHPADLLKFISWNRLENSYEDAVKKILEKKPVLGEPIVVPFKFWKTDIRDDSLYDKIEHPNGYTQELVFGIGSTDPEHPYIHCSVSHDILNYAVIAGGVNEDGTPILKTLGDLLDDFITKGDAETQINDLVELAMTNDDIINVVSDKVMEKNETKIENTINEKLRWKPLSDLITS